jgi:hypothetical protein
MTERNLPSLKNLAYLLFGFYVFINFFPTIRLVLIGGQASRNLYEYAVTVLPDIFILVIALFSAWVYYKEARFKFVLFDWLILLVVCFNTIYGFILSGDIFISAEGFRVTYLVVFFYFIGRMYTTEQGLVILKKLLLNVFKFYVVFAVLGFILHFGLRGFEKYIIARSGHVESAYFMPRIGSFVLMPVLFGTLMAFACTYFYHRLLAEGGKWNYLFIAILWAAMFLSVSRGPIIAFLLAFIVLTILSRKWLPALYIFGIITAISFALSLVLVGSIAPVGWIFHSTVDTFGLAEHNTRANLWESSVQDFMAHPGGYGLGHSGVTAVRFLKNGIIPAAVFTTDGWYLKLACESGIYGLLLYFGIFGFYFYKAARFSFKTGLTFFSFMFAMFIMVNAQNVVENVLDYYPCISLYWLIMGATQHVFMQKQSDINAEIKVRNVVS